MNPEALFHIKAALQSIDLKDVSRNLAQHKVPFSDGNKGLPKNIRSKHLTIITELVEDIFKAYAVKDSYGSKEELSAALARVLESYTVFLVKRSDKLLDLTATSEKEKILTLYRFKGDLITQELESMKPAASGKRIVHASDFVRSLAVWYQKAYGNGACITMNGCHTPTESVPLPSVAPPVTRRVAVPMNSVYAPAANTSTVGSNTRPGTAAPAPALVDSKKDDCQMALDPSPQAPVAVDNQVFEVSMETDSTPPLANNTVDVSTQSGTTPPFNGQYIQLPLQAVSALPAAVETTQGPTPFTSPSPQLLPIPEVRREEAVQFLVVQLQEGNARATMTDKERLAAYELPECAKMIERNILQDMLQGVRLQNLHQSIENEYRNRVNKQGSDFRILGTFVMMAKKFHRYSRVLLNTSSPPPAAPSRPSLDDTRHEFKIELHKALLETGQQLLSCENIPQLMLSKEQLEDPTMQLEALMFDDLENEYRDSLPMTLDQSCQAYVAEGTDSLKKIRSRDGFVHYMARYLGLPC